MRQVRRYVYQDVIRLDDLEKLIDCSYIQVGIIVITNFGFGGNVGTIYYFPGKPYTALVALNVI